MSALAGAIYIKQLLGFLGWQVNIVMYTDAAAAKAMLKRSGVGQVRTMETKVLWIQQKLRDGVAVVKRVPTERQLADAGTKQLSTQRMNYLCQEMGMRRLDTGVALANM